MKIVELCTFSAGICGVWSRVREESTRLAKKGHEVNVFSSDRIKGAEKTAGYSEKIGNVRIRRFPARKLGGESFMRWFGKEAEKEVMEFGPDVIVVHSYRHLHTTKALKTAKKLKRKGKNCRVFLVTHAPFERNTTRGILSKLIVARYDKLIGPRTLKKFDKIIAISEWEIPHLMNIGARKEKIEYIPNGIPEEFFRQKKSKEENKILFLGRIAPIKNLEILIEAIPLIRDKKIIVEIAGPEEKEYLKNLKNLTKSLGLEKRVKFSKPIYDIREKIKKIDSAKIFVLPSKSEGMPQSLIEAMARGKIVIGSNINAIRDLMKNRENGYLFEFDNPRDLADKINLALKENSSEIKRNARRYIGQFSWNKIVKKIEKLINS